MARAAYHDGSDHIARAGAPVHRAPARLGWVEDLLTALATSPQVVRYACDHAPKHR